ncbi:MAG TPA: metallopeptidase family protein, partial [Candidatus Limnocylindrales bacterium]|nr:metallopeptidase family protein [Candidatus Limnocylindrales bacterium]
MPLKRRGTQARRRPGRRVAIPAAPEYLHQPFEALVEMALDTLPAAARRLLENVAIVIEDEPSDEQLRASETPPTESLYGLYEGVSGVFYASEWAQLPNKISIFRLPLEEDFPDPEELAHEVQETILHELGHHAGLDESGLREVGRYVRRN